MTSTKKVNKKTLDKNKTKKHKINNKGGIKIGNMKVDITKNLEKARDYLKPHENAGKKCNEDNDCKLQPNNGNMAIPDNSIDCIDEICRTKSIKGTAAKVLNNRLKDLTTGFTTFFEGKESKTDEGNESDAAKTAQQLLNKQCKMEGKHIVAWYNVGDATQCLVYDMENGIMDLKKMGEENSTRINIPENSNADAILKAIKLENKLFQDIVYENLKNIDKGQNVLKEIRQTMYKSVEQKIIEKINIEDITILYKKVLPDHSPSKSSDEKDNQDKELLNEINDIENNKKYTKKNPDIISQAKAACENIKNNNSDEKNYKTYISSLTHFMLYHTFYFYKKDYGKHDTLQNAINNDLDKIKSSMANVHNTIKLIIHFGKGSDIITDEYICDFFIKKILGGMLIQQRLNRHKLYEIYTNNKTTGDGDDDEDGENTVEGEDTLTKK